MPLTYCNQCTFFFSVSCLEWVTGLYNVCVMGRTAQPHGCTRDKQTTMITLFSAAGHLGVVPSASHRPFFVVPHERSVCVNATTREQGLKLPHTFKVNGDISIENRPPDDVFVNNDAVIGQWVIPTLRWRSAPQSVQRKDFNTLLVTFQPEESEGIVRSTDALSNLPHSFTVEGVVVSGEKPRNVVTSPAYGVWYVTKPLTREQWSQQPTAMPWRKANDRNQILVEYEFFFPAGTSTDWNQDAF